MKIKNQFRISIVAFLIIVVIIATSIIVTEQQTAQLNSQQAIIGNIETGGSNLNYISNNYFLYQDNASIVLWLSQHSKMSSFLSSIVIADPQQKVLVQNVKSDLDNLKIVFDGVVLFLENSARNVSVRSLPEFQTQWSRMAVQIQALSFDSHQLSTALHDRANQLTITSIILIVALLGLFGAYFITNYFVQSRNTLKSISKLQDGISIIGSGDLNYSVKAGKGDEIEEISKSVNQMAANLRAVTVSKTDLELEIAERKRVEEALRESEQLYRTLFGNSEDGFMLLEPLYDEQGSAIDFRFLKVNDSYERQTGAKANDVLGKLASEVTPELESEITLLSGNVIKTGKSVHNEAYNKYSNKWYDSYYFPYAKGQVGILFRDITERKKAEEALKQSEIKFRTVADFTYDWEHWISPDGMFIYVSPSCKRITGFKPEEFIEDKDLIVKIVHPDDKALIESHYKSIDSKEHPDVDYRIITKSGEVRWIAHACQPVFDVKGTWLGRRGSNRDITERKQAQGALKESEERYSQLFSTMTEMFFVAELVQDDNGKVLDFIYLDSNPAFLKSIGKNRDQVVGKRTSELLGTIENYWLEEFNKVEKTGQAVHAEIKSGLSDRFYDVYAWKASIKQVGVIFEDITQRKAMEKQLQDNERMAAIGQTAGMVGHDIRNPLQAIVSELFLAKQVMAEAPKNTDTSDALESINLIQEQVDYISKIVADLQDYARQLNPEYDVVNLSDLLVSVFDTIVLPDKIKLNFDVKGALKLKTDPTFVKRAITNLVNNAIQAMPDGGELGLTAQKKEGSIVVTISDTGQGIPEHVKANLFKPFMTTKSKGQGLGLAVVKRLS